MTSAARNSRRTGCAELEGEADVNGSPGAARLSRRSFLGYASLPGGFLGFTRNIWHSPKRHRVLVSTDVGGTDPDDFQSLVHLLVCADAFDLEGIISSPYGPGRRQHILEVIERYEKDYPKLKSWSARYPAPAALRAMSKQGAINSPGSTGVTSRTEGSDWIIRCARQRDSRPLYVLVWGGIEDVAQALHDAPDILSKLRVYWIGGPNKMWSVDAYDYVEQNHPKLWMIESNATYRGFFVGGDQSGERGNASFVSAHIAGHGALGDYFATHLKGVIKMGDTPSVVYLLKGTPEDPTQPSWGGSYVRIWDGRKTVFTCLTTEADNAEVFGVVEFHLPLPAGMTADHEARMIFDNRIPAQGVIDGQTLCFRFGPRDAKVWTYIIKSRYPALDGQTGRFTAVPPPLERTSKPSAVHPNWWTDDPAPENAEGMHPGAKTVSRWRAEYLEDFRQRMLRCKSAKP